MKALDRKLIRDFLRLRGQVIAIALVVACGIASFVTMMSAYQSLQLSQTIYYERYRFADVFAQLKRAPETLASRIEEIPGVARVQTGIVVDVNLDVPGLDEPATGRLVSIPPQPESLMLNDLYIRRGRYIELGRRDEVLVSEAFSKANKLKLGDKLGAVIHGRWEQLRIVGIALSPEYVYEIRGAGDIFPDNQRFGVLWMNRDMLGPAFDMDGAFNSLSVSLTPGALKSEVIAQLDRFLERYGGLGAYGREDQISNRFVTEEIASLQATAVLVPSMLAQILGVVPGQVLKVEVLEGEHSVHQVSVSGLVDELVGVAAYMDIQSLNQLMQEGQTISGAYLEVDSRQLNRLYTQLKRLPAIASVSIREAAIARFKETTTGTLRIFTIVLVIFACIIAFGVVYNVARIALLERDRELATLRIIGFTRAEVAVILLGEQALLTLLAMPLGFGLGFGFSAWMSLVYDSEIYRLPLVVTRATFAFAFIVVTVAACICGFIVRQQLNRLDLIAVLKSRE